MEAAKSLNPMHLISLCFPCYGLLELTFVAIKTLFGREYLSSLLHKWICSYFLRNELLKRPHMLMLHGLAAHSP